MASLERLKALYDPETFSADGHRLIEQFKSYLSVALTQEARSLDWVDPPKLIQEARERLDAGEKDFGALAEVMLRHVQRLHSPRYMGHQVAPPLPQAGLFDALASLCNGGLGVYEMSPFFTAAERALVAKLGLKLGWREGEFDGIGTSGGTLANLTAVLAARNVRYPGAWEGGVAAVGKRPAVVAAEDAHYSISRAAGIMGIGASQVLKVPGDARGRMTQEAARTVLAKAEGEGLDVFCLVGSACSTPLGAFDCLKELAALAREKEIWFHVDGAHGASALFSEKYRSVVDGIELADSVTWDAHKMLYVPSLSTFLLYRRAKDSFAAFKQDAPYLFDPESPGFTLHDGALRTVECTKHCLSAALYGVWALHGDRIFGDLIDTTFGLAREFYELLATQPDFAVLHEPQANILCFRHVPKEMQGKPMETISRLQSRIRRALLEQGDYYITIARVGGAVALRVTLMNPFTTREHLEGLVARIRELGRGLL